MTFTEKSADQVTFKSGRDVKHHATFGVTRGDDKDLLQLSFEISDKAAKNARWFGMYVTKPLDPAVCAQADGIAFEAMADPGGAWWLQLAIRDTDGAFYRHVLTPQQLGATMSTRLVAFDQFKNKKGKTLPIDKVDKLQITGATYPDRLMLVKSWYLYSTAKRTIEKGVHFKSNSPINNLFEPGKTVSLKFVCPQGMPDQARGLICEVRDYFDDVVFTHNFTTADAKDKTLSIDYNPTDSGFYDVQAWWVDGKGQKIEDRSCIRTTGSMPDGHGSFAVMPRTIKQSEQRMQRVGDDAFLGLHGVHSNLREMIGVSWMLKATRLKWVEPNKPADRSSGYGAWVKALNDKTEPYKPWFNNIVNLGINLNRPKWAISDTPDVAPGLKSWDIYLNFFRDYIQVNKHNFPHMKHRIYDLAWEINLNQPGSGVHKPVYYPKDVVEIYKRARPILKREDPGALLVGPCCSSPIENYSWNLPLFEDGLLQYLDGYNCHGYHAPPPEEAQIPETFDKLRAAIKKYNHGKALPVYITELGYRSMYGSEDRQKDQARWHARVAGILKGEGIRAYYPFYSYDYKHRTDGSWGICYNLDPKMNFGPKLVSPKAAVPALAVFADQTEGLDPVTRLAPLSDDQWGYVYASKDGKDVVAMVWSVYRHHRMNLPVGDVKQVTVVDMMGRSRTLPVTNGMVALTLTPSPVYVRGLSSALYPAGQSIRDNLLAEVYPGDKTDVDRSNMLKNAAIQGVFGDVSVKNADSKLALHVAANCTAGLVGVTLKSRDHGAQTRWIAVREPLELVESKLLVENGKLVEHVLLHNHAQQPLTAKVRLALDKQIQADVAVNLAGGAKKPLALPLTIGSDASPTRTWNMQLKLSAPSLEPVIQTQSFNLLAAHEVGSTTQGKFNNKASWSGKGASGKTDNATATFQWQDNALRVDVVVHDDVFDQRISDGTIWKQDSIQFAFDTDPDLKEIYEPLAGIFTKKLSRLAFALTPNGPIAWRHNSHNEEQLPLGDMTSKVQMKITRDEASQITNYHMVIPWQQIGLDSVKAGKSIGVSILVNDSDGPQTKRAMYELFDGLTTRLPQNNGRLTLQ